MARTQSPKIAHKVPGRIRIQLPDDMDRPDRDRLVADLKTSPEVSKVTLRGSSLIIEHDDGSGAVTFIGRTMHRVFPGFERWSNEVDVEMAKYASDPWINKTVPFGFLGLALYRGLRDGAFLAGESAFALAYIAFDIYWKFQQENVIRKIEQGLSKAEKAEFEGSDD